MLFPHYLILHLSPTPIASLTLLPIPPFTFITPLPTSIAFPSLLPIPLHHLLTHPHCFPVPLRPSHHPVPPSLLASHADNQAGILTSTGYGVSATGHPNLMSPYGSAYSGHYIEGYRGQYPGHYAAGGGGGQVPPALVRPAPAPLAPRDRSSSAPNVCINLVNPNMPSDAASLAEFAHRMGRNYNPTSPGLCFCRRRRCRACPGHGSGRDVREGVSQDGGEGERKKGIGL